MVRQCSQCKSVLGDLAAFCDKCGARLGGSEETKEAFNFKAFGVGIGLVALVLASLVVFVRMSRPPKSSDPSNTQSPRVRATEGSIVAARSTKLPGGTRTTLLHSHPCQKH